MITLSHTTKINLVMELCKRFDMTIMECLALYMGIQFVYMHVGISMAYECYIYKCFRNFSLADCFNVSTPMDPSAKLTINMATPLIDATYYYIFKICKSQHCFIFWSHFTTYEFSSWTSFGHSLAYFSLPQVLQFTINKGN